MIKLSTFLLFIFFLSTSEIFAFPWPFDGTTPHQQIDRQNIGAWREASHDDQSLADGHFHSGLDIIPLDGGDLPQNPLLKVFFCH